jgi:hypothetical protein
LIVESLFTGAKQVASATISNKSFMLIDVSKTSLHFREDCGMFCEGEWEQKRRFNGHTGIVGLGLIGHPDLARLTGLVGFIGLIDFIGLIGLISLDDLRLMSLISLSALLACWLIGLISHVNGFSLDGLKYVDHISLVGCKDFFGQIGLVGKVGLVGIIGISFNGISGIIGQIGLSLLINLCIGLNGHIRRNGLIDHMGLAGHTDIASAIIISLVGRIVDRNGLIGLISLVGFGVISFVGLICLIGLVGLVNLGGISLVSLMGLIGSHISHGLGLVSFIGLNGRIGLNSHNDVIGLINSMEFEIPCYSLVREGWLWCVRRLCSLARLNSDFFFQHALQHAKQLFYSRIPQMTKYFAMRECEDSYTESLCCDSAFAHKKEFYIFKFPKRFLEIS